MSWVELVKDRIKLLKYSSKLEDENSKLRTLKGNT